MRTACIRLRPRNLSRLGAGYTERRRWKRLQSTSRDFATAMLTEAILTGAEPDQRLINRVDLDLEPRAHLVKKPDDLSC